MSLNYSLFVYKCSINNLLKDYFHHIPVHFCTVIFEILCIYIFVYSRVCIIYCHWLLYLIPLIFVILPFIFDILYNYFFFVFIYIYLYLILILTEISLILVKRPVFYYYFKYLMWNLFLYVILLKTSIFLRQ